MTIRTWAAIGFFLGFLFPPFAPAVEAQDGKEVVARQRALHGATISPAEAPAVLTAIAADLGATFGRPFGLLKKTSGNNCGGHACDIICDATSIYDVFGDGPDATQNYAGQAIPQWISKGALPGVCDFVPAGPPSPVDPPPTPVFDPTPILQRLDALERTLIGVQADVKQQVEQLQAQVFVTTQQLKAIQADVVNLKTRPIPVSCSAALNFGGARIPISCRLNF